MLMKKGAPECAHILNDNYDDYGDHDEKGASESVLIFSIVGARHSFAREGRNPSMPLVFY